MSPSRWLLAGALLLIGCAGSPAFERPACRALYDDCTDACADRCETRGSSPYDPDDSRRPPTLHDDDLAATQCASCVSDCRERAERCEAAVPETP